MALADKELTCVECGAPFIFTVGEQEFFASRGYTNDPKRCSACRSARKSQQRSGGLRRRWSSRNAPGGLRPVRRGHHGSLRSPRRPAGVLQRLLQHHPPLDYPHPDPPPKGEGIERAEPLGFERLFFLLW